MNTILLITGPIFLIIGLGYFCARKAKIGTDAQKAFSLFVFYCAMPAYLFMAMVKIPHAIIMNIDYVAAFATSMAIVALTGGYIARFIYKYDAASSILAMMGACYTNSAFIGIPIIVGAFGHAGFVIVITLFQVIIVTTTILTTIEIYRKHRLFSWRVLREFPKVVLLNPIVGGSLIGMIFAAQKWRVPALLDHTLQLLGNAVVPTALFALGLSLGSTKRPLPSQSRALVSWLVLLKTIAHPALAWLIGLYVFHLGQPWLNALVLIAAMPTALNNFVFAQRYNVFAEESSQIVFLSSIISLFTLSALLWLFSHS